MSGELPARYPHPNAQTGDHSVTDGTVIIIGGAEDKVRDRVILNRFVTLAGGRDATIVVISTASSLGTEAGERYRHIFTDLGVTTVRPIHAATRPQANDDSVTIALRELEGRGLIRSQTTRRAGEGFRVRRSPENVNSLRNTFPTLSGSRCPSTW